jgi:serine/threonine protein kinase/tetratricopeptide (TPR) repeat protein
MIGQLISHYQILEKIGSGGMGEIYLAKDTKLERQVALKFLPRHMTEDEEARLRFEREAKAAAALNHPNIVTVHEIGEHQGQVFIAMEYVEGRTLKELITVNRTPSTIGQSPIAPSPLPLAQVIAIAIQIASGLAAAHAKGIVHRDIKPQNILIDKDGRVKILDFGLAKLQGVSRLTQGALAMGTVHYMSPEQGLGKEVDPRSDIWSLGVVIYEMVSGEPPFRGDYDQAIIYAILNEDTPPLGVGLTHVGDGMENVIRRCLAKKSQDRYPSAEVLAAALRELDSAKEATKPEQSTRRKLSRRAFLTAISLLLLSSILGFIALNPRANAALKRMLGLGSIPKGRHMAVLPLLTRNDPEGKALADGFTAVIIDKLTWLEKFHDSLWTVPAGQVFQNRGKSLRTLQRQLGCNLFISGELHTEKNSLRLRLKLLDARSGTKLNSVSIQGNMANLSLFQDGLLTELVRLLELPEKPGADLQINAGGTAMPGAYILFLKGQSSILNNQNTASIDKGISSLEKALQQDNGYVQARLVLAEALLVKFKLSKDPVWLQRAMEQGFEAKQAAGPWAPAQLAWAFLLKESGQKSQALSAFQEVLRLDPRCYEACIESGKAFTAAGRISEAENSYKKAVALRPGYPPAYGHIAYFYNLNGRFDEALAHYKKMTELAPDNFNGFINMGGMYQKKGDRANAIIMFEKANAIQPNATAQSNLAALYFFDGNYRKALPLFMEAASKSTDYWLWGNLADTYRQLPDQKQKAGAAYQKAIDLAETLLAVTPEDSNIISCLAMYCAQTGEKAKALAAIARARALSPTDLEIIRRAILVNEAVSERALALAALREYRERLGGLEEIEKEPDLAALRRDPAYLQIAGREEKKDNTYKNRGP